MQEGVQDIEGSVQEEELVIPIPGTPEVPSSKSQVHLLHALQSSAFHKVYKLDPHLSIHAIVRYL